MHSPWPFIAAILVFGVARVVYRDLLSPEARLMRRLTRRKATRVREARGDDARVVGRVRAGEQTLRAPVTGRSCVAFRIVIKEKTRSGWSVVLELSDARPFILFDDSGEALVDTTAPFALALTLDAFGATGWFNKMDEDQSRATVALLEANKISATRWFGGAKMLAFDEFALEAGDRVSVAGCAVSEVTLDGERPVLRGPPERVVLRGADSAPLIISDALEALQTAGPDP